MGMAGWSWTDAQAKLLYSKSCSPIAAPLRHENPSELGRTHTLAHTLRLKRNLVFAATLTASPEPSRMLPARGSPSPPGPPRPNNSATFHVGALQILPTGLHQLAI